jgi:hypothetical protein
MSCSWPTPPVLLIFPFGSWGSKFKMMKKNLFILFWGFSLSCFCQDVCWEGSYDPNIEGEKYRTKIEGTIKNMIWTFERWGDCVCKVQLTQYKEDETKMYYKWKKLSGPRACDDNLSYVTLGFDMFGLYFELNGYKQVWDAYDAKYKIEKDDFTYSFWKNCKK